jgi:hypothetical protein
LVLQLLSCALVISVAFFVSIGASRVTFESHLH